MYEVGAKLGIIDIMKTTYETIVIGSGNHASIEIPPRNLKEISGNKRAPLKITINGHTYQSTATGVDGKCMVVFPMRDRKAAGVTSGEIVRVTLEPDSGYREVVMPKELVDVLTEQKLTKKFHELMYSKRKEFARSVADAKATETKQRRINKIITFLEQI
jgi:bifunctional DNA-binding transcriptional regulator/antitoxin component of YhaV-PrlF toxin-antitoxin module